jgi:hypothetical protein
LRANGIKDRRKEIKRKKRTDVKDTTETKKKWWT